MSLWSVVAGPEVLASTTDGEWRGWWLARHSGEQPLQTVVRFSGSALACGLGQIPDRVAQAVVSDGRSEVELWLDHDLPPTCIALDSRTGAPEITPRLRDPRGGLARAS
jgi:hypothetical protein